jgi:hypothetical protein
MPRRSLVALSTLGLVFALGCLGMCNRDMEGDEPGECGDGADNDRDGLFDCDDDECAGSPDCEDEETDTDTDADADTDTDVDTDADADADSDTDADSDADSDVEGYYQGHVEGLIMAGWDEQECVGEAVFDIFDERYLEGWALCGGGWQEFEGDIDGLVAEGDIAGTWSVTLGGWGEDEDLDINLEGYVHDGFLELWFDESTSSVDIEGLMVGERVE